MHKTLSRPDEIFLRYVVYPMFYGSGRDEKYKSEFDFPLTNKTYSTRNCPKFVIDNDYFTIVFLQHVDWFEGEECWEVSFHIRDHEWCDSPIQEFKHWYLDHYTGRSYDVYCEMNEMPKRFIFPRLNLFSRTAEDFCIEFWNEGKDFMLFKLFDLLRLF